MSIFGDFALCTEPESEEKVEIERFEEIEQKNEIEKGIGIGIESEISGRAR